MLKLLHLSVIAGCLCSLGLCNTACAAELTASDLINSIPTINGNSSALRSIEIKGHVKCDEAQVNFRAVYRAPDQYALLLSDGGDTTPIFFAANGQAIVYDPVRPVVIYLPRAKPLFQMCAVADEISFEIDVSNQVATIAKLSCDVKSILSIPNAKSELFSLGIGSYRLTLTSPGQSRVEATFDRLQPSSCTKLEFFSRDQPQPKFALDRIAVDGDLSDEDFAMPNMSQLSEKLSVLDCSDQSLPKSVESFALMMRTVAVRCAINNRKVRDQISGIDWDQIEANDKTYSEALRKFIVVDQKSK